MKKGSMLLQSCVSAPHINYLNGMRVDTINVIKLSVKVAFRRMPSTNSGA